MEKKPKFEGLHSIADLGVWQNPLEEGKETSEFIEDTRRTWPTKSPEQGSGLTETEVASTGPACVCTRSSVCILWLIVW